MRPYLVDLITRIADQTPFASSDDSISWHAHREAERLLDRSMVDEAAAGLASETDRHRRYAAHFIIGLIGINLQDPSCAEILITSLPREDEKQNLSFILQYIRDIPKPRELDLTEIYSRTADRRWQVRLMAVEALCLAEAPAAEVHVLNHLAQKHTYNDIASCNLTLYSIGTPESIPAISANLDCRDSEVRTTARGAIEAIKKRAEAGSRNPWPHPYARAPRAIPGPNV
jgi:hypothetical protein